MTEALLTHAIHGVGNPIGHSLDAGRRIDFGGLRVDAL
jgi:hypothetical protein